MNIFVVLATRDREDLLARTLASLARCRRPEGFQGTIVVENGSRGDAERVVREAPAVLAARYLFESAGNKSRALNAALSQIDDGLVVFLDDDVRVVPDLLESYAAAARGEPGHFFGGPVEADYEEAPPDWLLEFLPLSARGWRPENQSAATAKPFFLGFNWAAFAGHLRRAGGFSERLGPGSDAGVGDESDMQRRLVSGGVAATYVPEALVYHWVPRVRCSPEWALERAYRNGIQSGLLKPEDMGPAIAGYPLVLVKRAARSWLRSRMRGLYGKPGERFAAQVKYRRQRGELHGLLLKRGDRAAGQGNRLRSAGESGRAGADSKETEAIVGDDR